MVTWRRWGRVGAAAVSLFAVAACGDGASTGSSAAGDSLTASDIDGWEPPNPAPAGWGGLRAEVRSMRASTDDRQLVMEVTVSPVRLEDRTCGASQAFGEITDEGNPHLIWATARAAVPNVLSDETLTTWAEEYGACPPADATLELEIGAPLAGRDVVLEQIRWVADPEGDYGVCELPACDPESGGEPVVADCEGSALFEDIRLYGDVGRHADIGESLCQDGWAMVEVDLGAGACPAGEDPNPCAGERIDRLFLRASAPHWEVLTRTRAAGCGNVLEVAPDFPAALCENLPAL